MREISLQEFAQRIKHKLDTHPDNQIAFFLGAGCSRSSGIPTAGELVTKWLDELRSVKGME